MGRRQGSGRWICRGGWSSSRRRSSRVTRGIAARATDSAAPCPADPLRAAVDAVVTALEIPVPYGAVEIDRGLFEALEEVQVERAVVDGVSDLHPDPVPDERQDVAQRVHRAVHAVADAVAHGQRRQERQDQVRPRPQAPLAQRLTEVHLGLLEAELLLGDVEEPPDTQGAVDQEASELDAE